MSESEDAGRLIRMPGMVEAAPTKPDKSVDVPRATAKGLSRVLDIVELRIAKTPITQSVQKTPFPTLSDERFMLQTNFEFQVNFVFVIFFGFLFIGNSLSMPSTSLV